jgi:hypothetical protein
MKTRRRVIQGVCAVAAAVGSGAAAPVQVAEFRDGNSWFRLRIVGYQFPEATDLDDANWLMINGDCSLAGRQWTFTDPCLETWDVGELASWLEALAVGRNAKPLLEFTEPNLAFQVLEGNILRVIFSLESSPDRDFNAPESERRLDVPITSLSTEGEDRTAVMLL